MYRILFVALAGASIAATVGTVHGALVALLVAGLATGLTLLSAAVAWNRPALACALAGACLSIEFAVSAIALHGVDATGGVAFAGLGPADSAAVTVGIALIAAALLGIAFVRNRFARFAIAALALYGLVPTIGSFGRGGLRAALTDGLLARTHGAYVAAEVLLPLASVVAGVCAVMYVAKRRGGAAMTAVVLAVALLASSNVGSYAAGSVGLPTIVEFEHPGASGIGEVVAVTAVEPQAQEARNPPAAQGAGTVNPADTDNAKRLGPESVDDGIVSTQTPGSAAVGAASDAIGALSAGESSTAQPSAEPQWRELEQAIPTREYSLSALSESLPADAGALDAFVRDNVGLDVYDGALRGPLGAWLNRAANPTDKVLLLAWLLVNRGVQVEFVRGTLSQAQREQIARAATQTPPVVVPVGASSAASDAAQYFASRVTAGDNFAASMVQRLGASAPLGSGVYTAARIPARHYWIRIDRSGKPYDLDPTLSTTKEGEHLGTADGSVVPAALFPAEDYHVASVRFVQTNAEGTSKVLAQVEDRIVNLAYAPIRIGIVAADAPSGGISAVLVVGSKATSTAPIATAGSDSPAKLVLEVKRRDPAGATVTDRRVVYDRERDGPDVRTRALGLHTVVLAPGSAPMLFLRETYRNMISISENRLAQLNHTPSKISGLYPQRIADYLTRDDIVAATLSEKKHVRLYRDRANLVELHTSVTSKSGDSFRYATTFDIADNAQNAVGDGQTVARANLARGWADTLIERDLLSGTGAMTKLLALEARHVSFDLITKPTATADPARAGLDDGVSNGRIALAPTGSAVSNASGFAWWEIDPSTGTVVGRTTGGFGSEVTEYTILLRYIQLALFFDEVDETSTECGEHGFASVGCAASVCTLAISALLTYASLGHGLTAGHLAAEVGGGKVGGVACAAAASAAGGGEGHGAASEGQGGPGEGEGQSGAGASEPGGAGGGDAPESAAAGGQSVAGGRASGGQGDSNQSSYPPYTGPYAPDSP